MNRDLGLSNSEFGAAAGLFFVGYCLLEVPSNLALYRFGARRWLARIMISWGILSAACALVQSAHGFYALRIATGAAEAGFFPGVLYYLSSWFPARNRVQILSWFLVSIPLSSVVGGPISVWILSLDGIGGLKGWQWLFIMEGLPACLMGLLTLAKLRDTPADADWLSAAERDVLTETLSRETAARPRHDLLAAIADIRVIILTGILFSYWIGINGIAIWLPLILKNHQLTDIQVGFLSSVPYLIASIAMIIWARFMDRTGQYLLNLILACLVAAAGLAFSVLNEALAPAMFGLTVAVIGLSSVRPGFLQPSLAISHWHRRGRRSRLHKLGWQPWRVCRPLDGRHAQKLHRIIRPWDFRDVRNARRRGAADRDPQGDRAGGVSPCRKDGAVSPWSPLVNLPQTTGTGA